MEWVSVLPQFVQSFLFVLAVCAAVVAVVGVAIIILGIFYILPEWAQAVLSVLISILMITVIVHIFRMSWLGLWYE